MTSTEFKRKHLSHLTVGATNNNQAKVRAFMENKGIEVLRDLMEDYMASATTDEERLQAEGVVRVIRDFRAMNEHMVLKTDEQNK